MDVDDEEMWRDPCSEKPRAQGAEEPGFALFLVLGAPLWLVIFFCVEGYQSLRYGLFTKK